MGIQVEFNPDLALRNILAYKNGKRQEAECIPTNIVQDETYLFLKEGQRNYWLLGAIPLVETQGDGRLSDPVAMVQILEATHVVEDGGVVTKGTYKVLRLTEKN